MHLRLQGVVPLARHLHGPQDLGEDVGLLVGRAVDEAEVAEQDLLRDEVDVARGVAEALVDEARPEEVDAGERPLAARLQHPRVGGGVGIGVAEEEVEDDVLQLKVHEHAGPDVAAEEGVRAGVLVLVGRHLEVEVVEGLPEVVPEESPDEGVLVDVDGGVESLEDPLDAHVGDTVTEGLVQVPLDLQLQLELLLEERLPLQPDDETTDVDDVLPTT